MDASPNPNIWSTWRGTGVVVVKWFDAWLILMRSSARPVFLVAVPVGEKKKK